jgi:hypothetical protein
VGREVSGADDRRCTSPPEAHRDRLDPWCPCRALPVLQLEADLDDGTGRIMLVFLGRTTIGGIEAGRRITIEGTVSASHGHHVVLNPLYELEPGS